MTNEDKKDIIKRCLDNTAAESSKDDLGILYFARTFFSQCASFPQSRIHYRMMENMFHLFNPNHTNRMDRQVYIKVFREAAKSTYFSFVLPLYLINITGATMNIRLAKEGWEGSDLHDYDIFSVKVEPEFILILSETSESSKRFTMNIRSELECNRFMSGIFGDKTPNNIYEEVVGSKVWRQDAFYTSNGNLVFGVGAGKQVRGMLAQGTRPTLAIFDDIYSRNNTLTEETRGKIRYWFYAEAINTVDTVKGKVMLLGTMLHEDTVFTDVAAAADWHGFTYPELDIKELEEALSYCDIDPTSRTIVLPSDEVLKKLENKFTSIAWKERHSLKYLLQTYREKFQMGKVSYFYQEQLNILSSPADELFHDSQVVFVPVIKTKEYGKEWFEVEYQTYKWKGLACLSIGIDLAASERDKSDDTAIILAGYLHLYPQLDSYDYEASKNLHPHKLKGLRVPFYLDGMIGKFDVYEDDIRGKKGICNYVEYLCKLYNIKNITIEVSGQQGLISRELRKYLREKNIFIQIYDETHTMKKEEAIASTLLPIFQSNRVFMFNSNNKHSFDIWAQLKHLGLAKHDDGADGLKLAFTNAKESEKMDFQNHIVTKTHTNSVQRTLDWQTY
jgi:hypothetical protein